MKIPFISSPLDEYRKLNAEIEALDKYLVPVHAARLESETDLAKARAAFFASPSPAALNSWETARQRGVGMKNSDSFGSTFSHLETIQGDVESFANTQREALKTSAKAKQIYIDCLKEISGNVRKSLEKKRAEIVAKFAEVGVTCEIDAVQPLPTWRDRANALDALASQLSAKLAMPSILSRQGLIDEIREAIEANHLTAPAPTTPPPRQMQGAIPGAGLPVGHGVLNPTNPEPDTRIQTVPVNTINIDRIKAELDQVATEREAQCRAEAAQIAAANLAKQAQAVPA